VEKVLGAKHFTMSAISSSAYIADGKEVTHTSDTCEGQNYNANIAAFLMYSGHVLGIPIVN
jgi:hypothetical protein